MAIAMVAVAPLSLPWQTENTVYKNYSDHLFYIPDRPPAAPDTFSAAPPVELGHFLYQGLPSD